MQTYDPQTRPTDAEADATPLTASIRTTGDSLLLDNPNEGHRAGERCHVVGCSGTLRFDGVTPLGEAKMGDNYRCPECREGGMVVRYPTDQRVIRALGPVFEGRTPHLHACHTTGVRS